MDDMKKYSGAPSLSNVLPAQDEGGLRVLFYIHIMRITTMIYAHKCKTV